MYTAAILEPTSASLLKWVVRATLDLEKNGFRFGTRHYELPHHMTINLGHFDKKLNAPEVLGSVVRLKVSKGIVNHQLGVCAMPVDEAQAFVEAEGKWITLNSFNEFPHITCCLKNDAKPQWSNDLLKNATEASDWFSFEELPWLNARVCEN